LLERSLENAINDFRTARFLEPHWANLCFDEGALWLEMDQPELCADAWSEALRRAGADAPELYRQMLSRVSPNSAVRAALRDLTSEDPRYFLVFLGNATPAEAQTEISNFLLTDPELSTLNAARTAEFGD